LRHSFLLHSFALSLIVPALAACSGGSGSPGAANDASVDASNGQDASPPPPDAAPDASPGLPDATVDGDTADADNEPDAQGDDADVLDAGAKDGGETDTGAKDGGETDADAKDGGETDARAKDGGETDGGTPEGGVVPTSCVDLSGQYIENTDDFMLTRPNCGSLTWTAVPGFVNPANWSHVYTTDGVARNVTDEQGNPIVEEAHVDSSAMYVHRTNTSGLDINQKDYLSPSPCNLIGATGVYLTRETTGTQTNCELWQQE
jgi:hypothetical protein